MAQLVDYGMTDPCHKIKPQMSVAMAYVPYQAWGEVYEPDVALARATLFPDLDKPFIGKEAVRRD